MAEAQRYKKNGGSDDRDGWNSKKRKAGTGTGKSEAGGKARSAANKKRALKHERQSHRKHADAVVASKDLWNKLRLKTNSREEVSELMKDLMTLLRGKFAQVAMQHDASRVVQAAVQFGTAEQRTEIVKELEGNIMVELTKVQYAHFVVLKVIKYCVKVDACVKIVVKSLKGKIAKLAVHSIGARVVELLFMTFPPKSTALLKLELYGSQFALFSSGEFSNATSNHPSLRKLLENQPDKRSVALEHVLSLVNKGIEKGLFGFAYFQQLLQDYVGAATPNEIRSIAPSIVDHSIHMLSTRPGAIVVAECAAYGTVKERKRIIKSLKGYTRSSLLHRDAYIAMLRVIDVTDDTVHLKKHVLAELEVNPDDDGGKNDIGGKQSPILDLALSETGSKLFLMLLSEDAQVRRRYLDPSELDVLRPNLTVMEGGEEVPTCRKSFDMKRQELLEFMRDLLTDLCKQHSNELLRSMPGSKVLREVFRAFPSDDIAAAIVEACVDSMNKDDKVDEEREEEKNITIFEHPIGHLTLKHMLLDESDDGSDSDAALLAKSMQGEFKGKLMQVASSNRGAFVLSALATVECIKDDVVSELKAKQADILKSSRVGGETKSMAGFEALLNLIE